jgi:hypothetical protein
MKTKGMGESTAGSTAQQSFRTYVSGSAEAREEFSTTAKLLKVIV